MGTAPLVGRVLVERDELPTEAPVVVIGQTLWETHFASDTGVLGRTVKLGTTTATIVGVMPEGFGFPETQRIWTALRVNGSTIAPRAGPAASFFGRLAPGATMEKAQAELDVIGARMASNYRATHEHLRPRVVPYGKPILEGGEGGFFGRLLIFVNGIFLMLLTVICVNVATLVFARTATRGWEMAMRNALGASRGRIVTQLFLEALVLASLAAVFGLLVAVRGAAHTVRRGDCRCSSSVAGHEAQCAGIAAQRECRRGFTPLWRFLDDGDRRAGSDHRGVPLARRRGYL
jgi:putative ABC transport system permease protein